MAEIIRGTNIADPIVPYTTADNIPTHYAQYGKGGFRTVETIAERDAIPPERRESGMLVYVITDESNVHTYQWFSVDGNPNGEWKRSKMGGGDSIPIYDSEKLNELGPAADEDYIFVPSESDLEGQVTGNTYTTTKNGSYLDILFSAIRELQSEVARLRNAFNYGIYSYSGTNTAMSRVQGVYEGDVEEEPLWAIDEDGLSLQEDLIENISDFRPQTNIEYTTDERLPYFVDNAGLYTTWRDETLDLISGVDDSKLFLYITANRPDITLLLNDKDDVGLELPIDLGLILNSFSHPEWYNILIVISRKQKVEDDDENVTYFGSNFIWISVSNSATSNTIVEGYLNLDNKSLTNSLVTRENRYTINSIGFKEGLTLSKAIIYSKYQDFSQEVIPSKPTDSGFSYKAAHITIRSVSTYDVLNSIKSQLPENELIFVEDTKKLYIKNNYKLVAISGAGDEQLPPEDTMTAEEILQALSDKGIISLDPVTGEYTGLQPLEGITLINEETGKQFEVNVDAYGELIVKEILENETTLAERLGRFTDFPPENDTENWNNWRGFVGQLRIKENPNDIKKINGDVKLYSDRIKIGSFYSPVTSQLTFGCSHGFIELENTSNADFQLDGCYLHYSRKVGLNEVYTSHLALTGKVPANGTYLVRCKQYSDFDDPNTLIKVKTYDIEWYEKDITVSNISSNDTSEIKNGNSRELVDLSHNGVLNEDPHGLALTYGRNYGTDTNGNPKPFTYKCPVWIDHNPLAQDYDEKSPYLWWPMFIDAVYYNGTFVDSSTKAYWAATNNRMASCVLAIDNNSTAADANKFVDAIYKNTFELDPAKQAYQALNTFDSSRTRHQNVADYQYILLNNEYISFPKTDEIYPVTKFTPKASFEKKNVLTDKNKLDPEKPSNVTCSFGINPYTTRTFNWVSSGYFDEYIWIRKKAEEDEENASWNRFSSYTKKDQGATASQSGNYPRRREFDAEINNIVYSRIYGYFPGDENCTYTSHKCILDLVGQSVESKTTYEYVVGRSLASGEPDPEHTSKIMTFTLYSESYPLRIYQTTDQQGFHWIEYQAWGAAANHINDRIKIDIEEIEQTHLRWESDYATWEEEHAAWTARVQAYTAWENNPDHDPSQEPSAPGDEPIAPEEPIEGIIPILMNTGDMTQSGCRVNEWVDYYNAGIRLFDHLEQVNCVGNNDLCGTNVTDLGTGDDIGKSNSFYFHVFYCYEVDTTTGRVPIINGKYVPSLYHIDFKNFRLAIINSEITYENCKSWFGAVDGDRVINIYTGWSVEKTEVPQYYNNFTSIYTMIYHMLKGDGLGDRKCIVACHEMPFTVITAENLEKDKMDATRSANGNSLVGSHLNQINTDDKIATHWFSRLLEDAGVKLCIGGHKHTYAQTWPVRENYYYKVRSVDGENNITYSAEWTSSLDRPMTMREDLSEERFDGEYTVKWEIKKDDNNGAISGEQVHYSVTDASGTEWIPGNSCPNTIHLSKFPIIESNSINATAQAGSISPGTIKSNTNYGVTYFMCQATGFKLMSNKELPSPRQIFSRYLPQSTYTYKDGVITKSTADKEQRRPMYAVIDLITTITTISGSEIKEYTVIGKLIRLNNIQKGPTILFNQLVHGITETSAQYLYDSSDKPDTDPETGNKNWKYGMWGNQESNIINITQV